jgi:hypothetical protein
MPISGSVMKWRVKEMVISKKISKFTLIFGLAMVLFLLSGNKQVYAASVTINTIDYENEYIVVNNNGNSKIYFATENDAARNSWETMPADDGLTSKIDFSWVSPTTEQILVVKGEDGVQSRIILKERAKKLEISISYDKMSTLSKKNSIASLVNIMSSAGTGLAPIVFSDLEWRKGENGAWQDTSGLTVGLLEKLQLKGADLYFRIKAKNDTTLKDGTAGRRVSKEVRLKIAKKASPAVVGIDGEDFTAEIRYGKEYRVTYGGVTYNWVKVTDRSIREVPLSVIVNNGTNGLTSDKSFPAMMIEIRDYATATKAASKIAEIHLKAQRILTGPIVEGEAPEDASPSDTKIYVSYNGTSNITITIPSASNENPYQYCIVKPGDIFDLERAAWYTINRGSALKILASKAPEGSEIYIRQKEIKSKPATKTTPAVDYELASTYLKHRIEYPSVPVIDKKNITFVKDISEDIQFSIKLNTSGKLPFETEIDTIKLGTKPLTFTTVTNVADPLNPAVEYYINVTITKEFLNTLPNSYSRALYITFKNGTVDKSSVSLAIQSPTAATALSATASKGTTTGTTKVKVLTTLRAGNKLVYTVTPTKVDGLHTENVISGASVKDFVEETDITVTVGDYLTIYEVNSATNKVVRYKCIQITSLFVR